MKKYLLSVLASLLLISSGESVYAKSTTKQAPQKANMSQLTDKMMFNNWKKNHGARPKSAVNKLGAAALLQPTVDLTNSFSISDPKRAEATRVQSFKGALLGAYSWDEDYPPYGVYSFDAKDPTSFTRLFVKYDCPPNGGAFFADNKFYFTSYVEDDWGWDYSVTTYVVNTDTWKTETSYDQTLYHMATDLAYDSSENRAYGCFYNGDEAYVWGYMDPANECGVTQLAQLDGSLVAVAINPQGQAYGITSGGYLVKIDKSTGDLTLVGATGITPAYMQTATFDENGTLYWAAGFTDGSTGLFTVDLTNGHVTRVVAFSDEEEVVGMYAEPIAAVDGAPAQVTELTLDFTNGSLSGNVEFDVPTVDNLGAEITGNLNYTISIDGEDLYTGVCTPGSHSTIPVTVKSAGNHNFGVRITNTVGDSKSTYKAQWIGIGRPEAVTNLSMEKTGDLQATITWDAPTASVDNNYFDASRITYTITRMPDNVVVATGVTATTYVDNMTLEGQAFVSYKVTPYADDVAGVTTKSNGAVFGDAYNTPVSFTFDTEDDYNLFTIIDLNETPSLDSGCWQYSPSAQCVGYNTGTVDGDDWLITPGIRLEAGRIYLFSYDVLCYSDYWPDEYEVFMGQGATVEAMTTRLLERTTIYWEDYRRPVIKVTVESDGVYNFGFHALSEAGGAFFLIDNISVTPSYALKAPAASTNVTVTAGEKGAPKATVQFTTPTLAVDGSELGTLTKVEVTHDGYPVKTFENPEKGQTYSVEEEDLDEGLNEYKVVAYNSYGDGEEAVASAWVGIDTPVEPTNVKATVVDGHPCITWEAPSDRGANGGYVDTSALTYIVYRPSDNSILASDYKQFSFTDEETDIPEDGAQKIFQYGIYAKSTAGIGNPGSAFVISGEKYSLPFNESFKNGSSSKLWVRSSTYSDNWAIDDEWNGVSQDNDGGLLMLTAATPGSVSTIFSGKIDMTQAHNPVLSFYIYPMSYEDNGFAETSAEDDYLDVEVASEDFLFHTVYTLQVAHLEKGKYNLIEVPLTEYVGKDFIQIGFTSRNGGAQTPFCLDNISIASKYNKNLTLKNYSAPTSVDVLGEFTVAASVYNDGLDTATAYTVNLYKSDVLVESKTNTKQLAYGESESFEFTLTADASWADNEELSVEVVSDGDENADDNTATSEISVIRPNMPTATNLEATEQNDGSFLLTWDAPDLSEDLNATENFDSYTHGQMSGVGDWTFIDNDDVYGVDDIKVGNDYIDIPHDLVKQAFQVYNPSMGNIDLEEHPEWAPHSGNNVLASFRNWELDNDDWAVTPELSGNAQTIKFFAKTPNESKGDVIYAYYSTDGKTIDDLKKCEDSKITLTEEWVEYSYELPAGTKYFAIRYMKYNGYTVLLDDFSYEKAPSGAAPLEVLGYNLYRNGEKVNTEVITDTKYEVSADMTGDYTVKVVYAVGESEASNSVTVASSGIDLIKADLEDNAPIYDLYGRLVINPQPGQIYVRKGCKFILRK
jgi:hypothetical protein